MKENTERFLSRFRVLLRRSLIGASLIHFLLQSDFEMEVEINDDAEARRRFESCLPENWVLCSSKTHSGRLYYFNSVTGESRWEHPLIPEMDSPVS